MKKKEPKKVAMGKEGSDSSDMRAELLEKELKDLIEENENRSEAFSKIIKGIEKGTQKPKNKPSK